MSWSVLGPDRIGNLRIWAGTSGHDGYERIAGRGIFPLLTSVAPGSVEAASNPICSAFP